MILIAFTFLHRAITAFAADELGSFEQTGFKDARTSD